MGWEDRHHYHEDGHPGGGLYAILFGSVPVASAFGVRVRLHAQLLILICLLLVLGVRGRGLTWQDRLEGAGVLCAVVLLHEFGHRATARRWGRDADEIVISPLGALLSSRREPGPKAAFLTAASGPAVNALICVAAGTAIFELAGTVPFNPWKLFTPMAHSQWPHVLWHLTWVYAISYLLLLFNLLPIHPLDGGQMLQALLWVKLGWFRSMHAVTIVGMIGTVPLAAYGILHGSWVVCFVAVSCLCACFSQWRQLPAAAQGMVTDEIDYSESLRESPAKRRRRVMSRWRVHRLRKQAREEEVELKRIDSILAKVSAQGLHSLTWGELRVLRKATERRRRYETELPRE